MKPDHVTSALVDTGVQAAVLTDIEKGEVIAKLRARLGVDVIRRAPWDDRAAPPGQFRPDGWELIAQYVGNKACLMFLNGANTFWKFLNGQDLRQVLTECPPLEFYVCDEDARFLLCSNDHDFLIGWGTAQAWVETLSGTD